MIAVSSLVLAALEHRTFEELTEVERVIATVWALEADVNNGGFDQFFFNSSGDLAFFAPKALSIIGAPSTAMIVARANALFGAGGPPRERGLRQAQLAALQGAEERLEELDVEFYEYLDDLTALMHRYISANAPELLARVRT
ncbi:MAG: DMP19 family protein [Deltaproteobacteria bacterium]|nr:DMP19 family protein [Deltaproteobacteria bacterium]